MSVSTTFVSHGPPLRHHLASLLVLSRSIVGRREIRSSDSERWRTHLGMNSSACSRTTPPLRPEPKKTRKRRRGNGRGRRGQRKRPGKEDVQDVFFFSSLLWKENIRPSFGKHEIVGCTLSGIRKRKGLRKMLKREEECWSRVSGVLAVRGPRRQCGLPRLGC